MNRMPDLFSFAYVPGWYAQLEELAELAIPEPWRFQSPNYFIKNQDTPILERYIHSIFRKQAIDYNEEHSPEKASEYFNIGVKKMRRLAEDNLARFAGYNGNRYLIIRTKCEKFLEESSAV